MSYVFISYSKEDRGYAHKLAAELMRYGFDIWIDDRIDYGDDWELTIFDKIDQCAAFLVIMSPASYQSKWVRRECQHAEEHNKQAFPVLFKGEKFPRYNLTQYADTRSGKLPSDDFYERLAKFAHRKAEINAESEHLLVTNLPETLVELSSQASKSVLQLPLPHDMSGILPQPFDWCYIQLGKVIVEYSDTEKQEFDVPAFHMAKYPVTNAQFAKFIEAGGYAISDYWEPLGWRYKNAGNWSEPRYWFDPMYNKAENPVVGVSWYEAHAFCQWLDEYERGFHNPPRPYKFNLPTEQQWQRAAQGDDGRMYPWGYHFNREHCNTTESGIGETTPVTQYPDGASPFGVLDMSGNVWEWCKNLLPPANNHPELRVVARGGTYTNPMKQAQVTYRFIPKPQDSSHAHGFRLVWAGS